MERTEEDETTTIQEWHLRVAQIAADHGRLEVARVIRAASLGAFFAIERVGKIMKQADRLDDSEQAIALLLAEMDSIDTSMPSSFAVMD